MSQSPHCPHGLIGLPSSLKNIINEYLRYDRIFSKELISTTVIIFDEMGNVAGITRVVACAAEHMRFWGLGSKTLFPYISSLKRETSILYIE